MSLVAKAAARREVRMGVDRERPSVSPQEWAGRERMRKVAEEVKRKVEVPDSACTCGGPGKGTTRGNSSSSSSSRSPPSGWASFSRKLQANLAMNSEEQ